MRQGAGSSCTSHASASGTSSIRFRDASRASAFPPAPGSEPPPPVLADHGHPARRRPVRPARHHDACVAKRGGRAGTGRACPARRQSCRGFCVAVPPAGNPPSDVPVLPQSRRRRTGSGQGRRDGDSVRLPLPRVRHGVHPRLLDAADDRDGLEHAGRSLSAARGRAGQSSRGKSGSPHHRRPRDHRDGPPPASQLAWF